MRFALIATALLAASPVLMTEAATAQRYDDRGRGDRGDRDYRDGRGDRDRGRGGKRWDRNDRGWHGDRNDGWDPRYAYQSGNYGERRLGRNDRIYRGGDGRYYCWRSNGTTGLVIGALGGGLLGNALGGNTLGTLLGAGGGALIGQSVDRGNVRCR